MVSDSTATLWCTFDGMCAALLTSEARRLVEGGAESGEAALPDVGVCERWSACELVPSGCLARDGSSDEGEAEVRRCLRVQGWGPVRVPVFGCLWCKAGVWSLNSGVTCAPVIFPGARVPLVSSSLRRCPVRCFIVIVRLKSP